MDGRRGLERPRRCVVRCEAYRYGWPGPALLCEPILNERLLVAAFRLIGAGGLAGFN